MTSREVDQALPRAILTAPVPIDVRLLFAHLPPGAEMEAILPSDMDAVPLSARQIVKLASLGGALRHRHVRVSTQGEPLSIILRHGPRSLRLGVDDFASDLHSVCARLLDGLFDMRSLARTLEAFAAESASLSTLSTLTSQMLRAPDLDHALYAMLSGVTSGFGLAFHRAALFVLDPEKNTFVGSKGIGPADEGEAHRIWEEMEVEGKELTEIVLDYAHGRVDNRFEKFIGGVVLREGPARGDELDAVLASTTPVAFATERARNDSLRALRPAPEFVLAAIRPRSGENVRALLFADDAWSKRPIAESRVARLGPFLDQLTLVWDNLALLQRIERLARVDALTGAHNRRVFEERLTYEQSRARRSGSPLTLLVIDIDHFKEINDAEGHAAGDDALRKAVALFADALREHDTVARIGGDEFGIILPGVAREEALVVARRIGGLAKPAGLSLSIGGASVPEDTPDATRVLALADANLYAAKRAGRCRACLGAGIEARF